MIPPDCPVVDARDLLATQGPAILVLGVHPSDPAEARRVVRVVRHLRGKGPVRVAVEMIEAERATDLWALRGTEPDLDVVPQRAGWRWRGDYAPWRPLFALGLTDVPGAVELVAAGPPSAPPGSVDRRTTPLPSAEADRLAASTGNLPNAWRLPFASARAWTDARFADVALDGWSGQGVLVVVADHTRVAGSSGIAWHLTELSTAPVRSAVVYATEHDCAGGAQAWAPPPSWIRARLARRD